MNWDTFIPYAMFVFNSSEHRSTGKQPYEVMYGRKINMPNSITKPPEPRYNYEDYHIELKQKLQVSHQIARDRLMEQKQKTKEQYDQNQNPTNIHVGDRVLLKNNARKGKLSAKWLGPYEVIELKTNENDFTERSQKDYSAQEPHSSFSGVNSVNKKKDNNNNSNNNT